MEAENTEIVNVEHLVPEDHLPTACDELHDADGIKYQSVESFGYSITTGKLSEFCVEPNYKWFKIYLHTEEPGSLTVTIPKSIVDLKQFDYESCNNPPSFYTNIEHDRNTTITQITQTDTLRTLQFTWNEPIKYLEYFGVHDIFDGVDHSEPNYCIGLVESGLQSAEIQLPSSDEIGGSCSPQADLNAHIINGKVKRICPFEDSLVIILKDTNQNSTLKVDIPYTMTDKNGRYDWGTLLGSIPLITHENDLHNIFVLYDSEEVPMEDVKLIRQCQDYQTFEFDIPANVEILEIVISSPLHGYQYHGETNTTPLLEIQDNCIPLEGYAQTYSNERTEKTMEYLEGWCKHYDSMTYNDMVKSFNIPNDSVEYEIIGGELLGISHSNDFDIYDLDTYDIFIDATEDGLLVITIPNSLPDDSSYGVSSDIDFAVVVVNDVEVYFDKITTKDDITYSIPFPSCGQVITIVVDKHLP